MAVALTYNRTHPFGVQIKETQVSFGSPWLYPSIDSAFLYFRKTSIAFTCIKYTEIRFVYKEVQWNLSVKKTWPFVSMFHI